MSGKLPVFNIERFAIHDGEGIRTAVFLQGCPLNCLWCANPESRHIGPQLMFSEKKCAGCGTCMQKCPKKAITLNGGKARIDRAACVSCGTCEQVCPNGAMQISGNWTTAEDIFSVIVRDADYYRQTHGGVTFSGGEALLHIDSLMPLLEECAEAGIAVDFETCGHVPVESFQKAFPYTEQFLFDVKTADPEVFRRCTGGRLSLVLNNLHWLAEKEPGKIILRVPVIPDVNHGQKEMESIFRLAVQEHISRVDLLPYHTLGMIKYAQLGLEYPFPVRQGLSVKELELYAAEGMKMGLDIRVGG